MRLIFIAMGWAAGIMLAARLEFQYPPLVWLGLAGFLLIPVWFTRDDPPLRMVNMMMVALALGGFRYSLAPDTSHVSQWNNSGGIMLEGVIIDDPDVRDDRVQFRLRADTATRGGRSIVTSGLVLVEAPRVTGISYGDRVAVSGELITPGEFDTFSYSAFLARQNVFSIMQDSSVTVQSGGHASSFYMALFDLRARAHDEINDALPEPQAPHLHSRAEQLLLELI